MEEIKRDIQEVKEIAHNFNECLKEIKKKKEEEILPVIKQDLEIADEVLKAVEPCAKCFCPSCVPFIQAMENAIEGIDKFF